MLEVAVKEKKDTIERIIEEADCEIQEARGRLEQLDAAAQEAAQTLEAAKANEEQERTSYNALKDGYKQIEAKLKQLKTLRDTIEKDYDDTNKMAGMYFLLKELKAELASIQILSKDELEQALYAAWNRLKKAKNYLRAMTASNDAAKDAARQGEEEPRGARHQPQEEHPGADRAAVRRARELTPRCEGMRVPMFLNSVAWRTS